jgi:hypothetical protein
LSEIFFPYFFHVHLNILDQVVSSEWAILGTACIEEPKKIYKNFSEDSLSFLLSKLKLNHEISFSESACVSKMPKNMNLHMDALFDEFRASFTNVS